ncbi:sugar transferase [Bradyrhizobium sp. BWC-3-1]|uniref:sugar transferase n=1 Tax=Bradyrhizobium sp. BWC-3-1 TaxID=3080012 RepID=UPI00293E303C|nr:sugar transferase [Bradyrhizobium sp. BWC-3-1]WOH56108.1 sugar transferase [Bradyrhizobium sp. BWC-3-1]
MTQRGQFRVAFDSFDIPQGAWGGPLASRSSPAPLPLSSAQANEQLIFSVRDLVWQSFAIAAVAIRLDYPGPILFKQQRCGFNGRILIRKFRTMHALENGPVVVQQRLLTAHHRVGRWLGQTSVDELPQLLNVLDGSMSLVDPGPPCRGTRRTVRQACSEVRLPAPSEARIDRMSSHLWLPRIKAYIDHG